VSKAKRKRKSLLPWWLIALFFGGTAYYVLSLPNPAELQRTTPDYTALMLLRMEQAKEAGRKFKIRKRFVPLKQISPLLKEAVRVSEDASFYDHDGFDFDEIQDAVQQSIKEGRAVRGASTISQQLVKNVYLSPSRNPIRKLSEAILTYRLEKSVDKTRILELYLNLIEWGDGIFGIEQAAREHFKESASTLSPAQAVLLAAMLPAPLKVNPADPNRWLKKRARRLLKELRNMGRISELQYSEAAVVFTP